MWMNKVEWCPQSSFLSNAIVPLPSLLLSKCLGQVVAIADVKL